MTKWHFKKFECTVPIHECQITLRLLFYWYLPKSFAQSSLQKNLAIEPKLFKMLSIKGKGYFTHCSILLTSHKSMHNLRDYHGPDFSATTTELYQRPTYESITPSYFIL